ncbi:MAG TPA: Bax inhibitor-1 family protein, partial [Tepidisphaeraceae bacterium]|nr:Bax inhibitor-1 family protein [Tepidisphaeraceae bacterium]
MSRYPTSYPPQPQVLDYGSSGVVARFMNNVYAWMAAGLALTAVVAWWVSTQRQALQAIFHPGTFIFLVLVELGLVIAIS